MHLYHITSTDLGVLGQVDIHYYPISNKLLETPPILLVVMMKQEQTSVSGYRQS